MAGIGAFGNAIEPILDIVIQILAVVAIILVIWVYMKFRKYILECKPWKLMFIALVIFIAKKFSLWLSQYGILYIPSTAFNVLVAAIFIYAILIEIDIVKKIEKMQKKIKRNNVQKKTSKTKRTKKAKKQKRK